MGKNKNKKKPTPAVPKPETVEQSAELPAEKVPEAAIPDLDALMRSDEPDTGSEPVENPAVSAEDALLEMDFGETEPADIPTPEHTEAAEGDMEQFAPAEDMAQAEEPSEGSSKSKRKRGKKNRAKAEPAPVAELEFVTASADVPAETPADEPVAEPAETKEDPTKTAGPVRIVVTLMVICGIVALLLSAVNAVTKDVIAENAEKKQSEAILRIFTEGTEVIPYAECDNVWLVYQDDTVLGYCAAVTPMGYVDDISMMVGVDAAGQVVGVQIVDMSETSGIGTKTKSDSFLDQFIGKTGTLTVGENVDGITGATYSSRGVTEGVNMALALDVSLDGTKPIETEPIEIETEPVESAPAVPETEPVVETEPDTETETTVETETEPETETKAPETTAPETKAPETKAPETIPPVQVTVPETPAPETNPPETQAPETVPPVETQPETIPETEPETIPETEPETMPETEPETVPETQPETEPETVPETETEKETTTGSKFPIRH